MQLLKTLLFESYLTAAHLQLTTVFNYDGRSISKSQNECNSVNFQNIKNLKYTVTV